MEVGSTARVRMKSINPSMTTNGEGISLWMIDIDVRKCGKWPWLDTKLIHTVNDEN